MRSASRIRWRLMSSTVVVAVTAVLLVVAGPAQARASHHRKSHSAKHFDGQGGRPGISSQHWGGRAGVNLYTLTNGNGMTVKITNYGGVVQSIWVPNRERAPPTSRSASRRWPTT